MPKYHVVQQRCHTKSNQPCKQLPLQPHIHHPCQCHICISVAVLSLHRAANFTLSIGVCSTRIKIYHLKQNKFSIRRHIFFVVTFIFYCSNFARSSKRYYRLESLSNAKSSFSAYKTLTVDDHVVINESMQTQKRLIDDNQSMRNQITVIIKMYKIACVLISIQRFGRPVCLGETG